MTPERVSEEGRHVLWRGGCKNGKNAGENPSISSKGKLGGKPAEGETPLRI